MTIMLEGIFRQKSQLYQQKHISEPSFIQQSPSCLIQDSSSLGPSEGLKMEKKGGIRTFGQITSSEEEKLAKDCSFLFYELLCLYSFHGHLKAFSGFS